MRHGIAALLTCLGLWPVAPQASEEIEGFVEANLLAIFYHELGHALIDIEALPIFGQEEDAADVFSIFLIDALFEEEAAQYIAFETALGFLGEALLLEEDAAEVTWSDTHGPDAQRFHTTVCLFYGANPQERETLAAELDLPAERAETCPAEYDQAAASWGAVLDTLWAESETDSFTFATDAGLTETLTHAVIADEVAALAREIALQAPVAVVVAECGEANAFYDPDSRTITMCIELESHLRAMASRF